jgi:ubiquinone/menaquinone biosynthesis C-methylase UbiE
MPSLEHTGPAGANGPAGVAQQYWIDLAAAFVRGKLGPSAGDGEAAIRAGLEAGLRLHKFKRNAELPRVRRVLGMLRGLAPENVLDIGSGRGTFLWPLMAEFSWVAVTAVDITERRAGDIGAVRRGGIERLNAVRMDAQRLAVRSRSFDVVTALEVLEHLPDPAAAMREALRVARRYVVASAPSKQDDNPEHIHLFEARDLEAMLRGAGAERVTVEHVLNHRIALAQVKAG